MFQNFAEFVALHYAFSKRNDTEYWKANNARVYDKDMPNLVPTRSIGFADFAERKMFKNVFTVDTGLIWIATGMNHFIIDEITVKEIQWKQPQPLKSVYAQSFTDMELNKTRWRKAANNELSLCDWLEKYVHNQST
jgi:hypothetical protein